MVPILAINIVFSADLLLAINTVFSTRRTVIRKPEEALVRGRYGGA